MKLSEAFEFEMKRVGHDHPRCDCGDYLWRDTICKHIIAARLREGDEAVIVQVGELVRMLRKNPDEA